MLRTKPPSLSVAITMLVIFVIGAILGVMGTIAAVTNWGSPSDLHGCNGLGCRTFSGAIISMVVLAAFGTIASIVAIGMVRAALKARSASHSERKSKA
jgi:hypothetical protein